MFVSKCITFEIYNGKKESSVMQVCVINESIRGGLKELIVHQFLARQLKQTLKLAVKGTTGGDSFNLIIYFSDTPLYLFHSQIQVKGNKLLNSQQCYTPALHVLHVFIVVFCYACPSFLQKFKVIMFDTEELSSVDKKLVSLSLELLS